MEAARRATSPGPCAGGSSICSWPAIRLRGCTDTWDDGAALLRAAGEQGLEGIVSKQRSAPYRSARQTRGSKSRSRGGRRAIGDGSERNPDRCPPPSLCSWRGFGLLGRILCSLPGLQLIAPTPKSLSGTLYGLLMFGYLVIGQALGPVHRCAILGECSHPDRTGHASRIGVDDMLDCPSREEYPFADRRLHSRLTKCVR